MNRKHKITISIAAISIILLALIGLTYGYFLTRITGNDKEKSISVTTANLALVYGNDNGSIIGDGETIEPGKVFEQKTFTVENKGNAKIDNYAVILENYKVVYASTIGEEIKDASTTLAYPGDFNYTITCKVYDAEEYNANPEEATLKDQKEYSGTLPNSNDILLYNSIDLKEIHVYEFNLVYEETKTDQSADMNKRIEGKLNIIDTTKTIDVEGDVTNYEEGDYVQTNSIQRISQIDSNGNFKIVGLEPGKHTIRVFNSSGEEKGSKTFTIETGETAGINNDIITIDDKSRTFTIDIDATNEIYTIGNTIQTLNPFSKGTLAYSILNNAVNITEEQKELGYAEYRDKPLTTPAVESTMLYKDGGALEEKTKKYVSTKNFTTTNAAKYYITYGDTATYTSSYTITNADGSALQAVLVSTGYETLIGKYIVAYAGSTSSTAVSGSSKSTIYYVINATSDATNGVTIEYLTLSGGLASNEKYITYGDSYKFNASTGSYTLNNVQVIKYKDGYNELVGKYVVNVTGGNSSTATISTNLSNIYLVTENSTETVMTYKTIVKERNGSAESTLTTTADEYGTSYYYRGGVENNYLTFNNGNNDTCWRIVRIEGDGAIKMVLADATAGCSTATLAKTDSAYIGTGDYGYDPSYKADYENSQNRTTSMKYKFNEWYITNLSSVTSKLKTTTACIGDTTTKYDYNGAITTNNSSYVYEAYVRLYGKGQTPNATLMCNATGGKTSPTQIFPLTADEVVFAGGKAEQDNYTYYLRDNATTRWWVTLSPSTSTTYHRIFSINTSGKLDASNFTVQSDSLSLRPAVSLVSGTQFLSGDGSINNPYTIK